MRDLGHRHLSMDVLQQVPHQKHKRLMFFQHEQSELG